MATLVKNWEDLLGEIIEEWNKNNPEEEIEEGSWAEFIYELPNFDSFEIIEQNGGGEGGGENCNAVFTWKDKYYNFEYNYYSYHGVDFDAAELYEVTPTKVMTTVYV